MAQTNPQIYPSRLSASEIRLLQFLPRSPADGSHEPRCRLSVHDLVDAPAYTALSYAWNEPRAVLAQDEPIERLIRLNGQDIPATPNLYHAIHHLASSTHADKDGCFWIDAICIDQASVQERTTQVSIMHLIYRQAAYVYIWLGPDLDHEAYSVREFFRALVQKFWIEDSALKSKGYKLGFLAGLPQLEQHETAIPGITHEIWLQAYRFWGRAWFSRVWVQQKVALARATRFWCGDVEFTERELVTCSKFLVQSGLSETLINLRISQYDSERELNIVSRWTYFGRKVGASADRIPYLRELVGGTKTLRYPSLEYPDDILVSNRLVGPVAGTFVPKEKLTLVRLLARTLFTTYRDDCTDPRDRVFALLVLFRETAEMLRLPPLPLEPDYSKNVAAVFTETVGWLIQDSGWLGMLALIHPQRREENAHGLPSWVPDFHSSAPKVLCAREPGLEKQIINHFAMITADTRPMIRSSQLIISARRIGTLADIGDSYDDFQERGIIEATAQLLLKVPHAGSQTYTRMDYFTDTMEGAFTLSRPLNGTEPRPFRQWYMFKILRMVQSSKPHERIQTILWHLSRMPSVELLAHADDTRTIPTRQDWIDECGTAEQQEALLKRGSPPLRFEKSWQRRLFRLVDLGYPCCPSATLLGFGPEAVEPSDELFVVVGSVMPLVLRKVGERDAAYTEGVQKARLVGEAFMTSFDDIVQRMEGTESERIVLV